MIRINPTDTKSMQSSTEIELAERSECDAQFILLPNEGSSQHQLSTSPNKDEDKSPDNVV